MALRPCTGCGKPIDTTAKICPGCRRFLPTTSNPLKGLAAAVLLGFAVLFAAALFQIVRSLGKFGSPGSPASTSAGPRPRKGAPSRW